MIVPHRCPRCGVQVAELDYADAISAFAGLPAVDRAAIATTTSYLAEVYAGLRGSEYWLTLRTHTAARCTSAAAGHPDEPPPPL